MSARKVTRSIHEGARDLARDIASTDAYLVSRRQRTKVAMLFAHLKRILCWIACACAAPVEQEMTSTSPQQPRTSENGKDHPNGQAGVDLTRNRAAGIVETHRPNGPAAALFNRISPISNWELHLFMEYQRVWRWLARLVASPATSNGEAALARGS